MGLGSQLAPISRPWLVQAPLGLGFLLPIATAIGFSPARRPTAPGRRQYPAYRHKLRTGFQLAPISSPWLVQAPLGLGFLLPIATAIGFSPARRQHPDVVQPESQV